VNRSERAQRAETKLAGLSKLKLTGYQHGMHVFQVNLAGIWNEVSLERVGAIRRIPLQDYVAAALVIPARLKHRVCKP
jgi:hypothetical protein